VMSLKQAIGVIFKMRSLKTIIKSTGLNLHEVAEAQKKCLRYFLSADELQSYLETAMCYHHQRQHKIGRFK